MQVSSCGPDASRSDPDHLVFDVRLVKPPGARLGIEVLIFGASNGASSGLIIDKINDFGLAEAWNQTSPEPYRLRPGDVITRVNGIEGNDEALANELRSDREVLNLALLRFGSQAHEAARLVMQQMSQLHQYQLARMKEIEEQQARRRQLLLLQTMNQPQPQPPPGGPASSPWPSAAPSPSAADAPPAAAAAAAAAPAAAAAAAAAPAAAVAAAACLRATFEARIVRPQSVKLGIGVLPVLVLQVDGLMVRHVSSGGAVDLWNQTCPEGRAIQAGDAIVCVNGLFCCLEKMMAEIRTREELRIAVLPQAAFGAAAARHPRLAAAGSEGTDMEGTSRPNARPQEVGMLWEQNRPPASPYPAQQSVAHARGGACSMGQLQGSGSQPCHMLESNSLRDANDREGPADLARWSHESMSEPTPPPTHEPFTGVMHRRQWEQWQQSQQSQRRQQEEARHMPAEAAHGGMTSSAADKGSESLELPIPDMQSSHFSPLPDAVPPTFLGGLKAARSVVANPAAE